MRQVRTKMGRPGVGALDRPGIVSHGTIGEPNAKPTAILI